MMLSGGDYNVDSMRRYSDSLKGVLKQAILDQEAIFRRQVHELHRLYNLQKTLMEDLRWKSFCSRTSWVDLTQTEDLDVLEGRQGIKSMHQTTLDLLPAYDCFDGVGKKLSKKGDSCASLIGSLDVNTVHDDDHISNPDESEFPLSAGKCASNKRSFSRTSWNEQMDFSTVNVLCLKESIEKVSKEAGKRPIFIDLEAPMTYTGETCGLQNHVSSDSSLSEQTKKDSSESINTKDLKTNGEIFQQKFFTPNKGSSECHDSSQSVVLTEKRSSVSRRMNLDLNIFFDEPTHLLNSPAATFPSPAESSSGVLQACPSDSRTIPTWCRNNDYSNETTKLLKQDNAVHLTSPDSGEKSTGTQGSSRSMKFEENSRSSLGVVHFESLPVDRRGTYESFGSCGTKPSEQYMDLPLGRRADIVGSASHADNSTITLNSELANNHLCSLLGSRDLPHSAGDVENGNGSCEKSEDAVSSNPYKKTCPSQNESVREDNHTELQQEVKEMDDLVCGAAESLIQISLEKSICYRDGVSNAGICELAKEQSDHESSDSYESLVLRMKESSLDDFCVTSMAIDIMETDNKGPSLSLRRGRRLKDFQKDILPGLISLSRHEICEDMHCFDEIVKSRDLGKNNPKKASELNWWSPKRSRRSKLGNGARRISS